MYLPDLFFIAFVACWILAIRNVFFAKPQHPRTWRTTAALLTIGLSSVTAAYFIGSSVDEQGFLHEPFFLIGGGSLLNLAGMILTFILLLLGLFSPKTAVAEGR